MIDFFEAKKILHDHKNSITDYSDVDGEWEEHPDKRTFGVIMKGLDALDPANYLEADKKYTFRAAMDGCTALVGNRNASALCRTAGHPLRDLAMFLSVNCKVWLDLSGGPSIDEQLESKGE